MSVSSLIKEKTLAEPYNINQVWVREFTNGVGQTVLLQLYSPSGGFTYPHRQLLGKLFSESKPKGFWVSRESFESALRRKHLRSSGKLKSNAWTLSALVNAKALTENALGQHFSPNQEREIIDTLEAELIENLDKEKARIINAIKTEPGTENSQFIFVKVDLTDQTQPEYENQIAALGYFATNIPSPLPHQAPSSKRKLSQVGVAESFSATETQCSSATPFFMPAFEGETEAAIQDSRL